MMNKYGQIKMQEFDIYEQIFLTKPSVNSPNTGDSMLMTNPMKFLENYGSTLDIAPYTCVQT